MLETCVSVTSRSPIKSRFTCPVLHPDVCGGLGMCCSWCLQVPLCPAQEPHGQCSCPCTIRSLWIGTSPVTQSWQVNFGLSNAVWFLRSRKNLCISTWGILECFLMGHCLLEPTWYAMRHFSHMESSHVLLWSPVPDEVPADGQCHLLGIWVSNLGCPPQSSLQMTQPQQPSNHNGIGVPKWKPLSWAQWPHRTLRDNIN